MPKKTRTKAKVKRVPITQKEYLERLIRISEDAISKHGNSIDDYFANQAERLRKQLKELK